MRDSRMNSLSCNLDATNTHFKAEVASIPRGWKQRAMGTQKEKREIILGGRTFCKQINKVTLKHIMLLPFLF